MSYSVGQVSAFAGVTVPTLQTEIAVRALRRAGAARHPPSRHRRTRRRRGRPAHHRRRTARPAVSMAGRSGPPRRGRHVCRRAARRSCRRACAGHRRPAVLGEATRRSRRGHRPDPFPVPHCRKARRLPSPSGEGAGTQSSRRKSGTPYGDRERSTADTRDHPATDRRVTPIRSSRSSRLRRRSRARWSRLSSASPWQAAMKP